MKNIEDVIARNKLLEEENNVLKNLIHEEHDKPGRFDERRLLMLKCQIYQLEKQINILSKSLSFRKNAHTDSLNTISILSDSFRSIVQSADSRSLTPVKTLSVERSELVKWTELAESTRLKLIRSEEGLSNGSDEGKQLSEASLLSTSFSKSNNKHVDMLDVCSGSLDHVNLKQVAFLESNLAGLFRKLTRLKESLHTNLNEASKTNDANVNVKKKSQLLPLHKENLKHQLEDCCAATQESCDRLFDLALIVPSAPWVNTFESLLQTTSRF